MSSCKFCGVDEGAPDRNGKAAHINRDGLCAPCYYILERVKYQPDKLDVEQRAWFDEMCRFNMQHGMFVPIVQRRLLKHLKPAEAWRCGAYARKRRSNDDKKVNMIKGCGTMDITKRDPQYTNYCVNCATAIREWREMPRVRNTRSDKGTGYLKKAGQC